MQHNCNIKSALCPCKLFFCESIKKCFKKWCPNHDFQLVVNCLICSKTILYTGCNFYGSGAVFFGCLDMMIHGTVALSRYLMVIKDQGGEATFTLSCLERSINPSSLLYTLLIFRSTYSIHFPQLQVVHPRKQSTGCY